MIGLVVLWTVPAFFAELFTCVPLAAWRNPKIKGKCIDYPKFRAAIMSLEVVLDSVILALPIREIIKLQMPLKRKIMVSCVFLLGGL